MNFEKLRQKIQEESANVHTFEYSVQRIQQYVFESSMDDFIQMVSQIGTIPESISHDSSEEKLYAKAADVILARSLIEVGIATTVNRARAGCADVVGKSKIHGYTLVGDAKAFRLSRTAKNQKDFKVKSMADWREDHDYAILVCPYFQYPKVSSQIYGQALDEDVCLFSWEQFYFLLKSGIRETTDLSLAPIWGFCRSLRQQVAISDKNSRSSFLRTEQDIFCQTLNLPYSQWDECLQHCRKEGIDRGKDEIEFWQEQIRSIRQYTREQAVNELLLALELEEKIRSIGRYVQGLRNEVKQ